MQDTVLANLRELCQTLEERYHLAPNRKFIIEKGKKYYKVISQDMGKDGKVIQRSAHCFVDQTNGNVYKANSWSGPAKGIRYNLVDPESKQHLLRVADPHGGYLYRC